MEHYVIKINLGRGLDIADKSQFINFYLDHKYSAVHINNPDFVKWKISDYITFNECFMALLSGSQILISKECAKCGTFADL